MTTVNSTVAGPVLAELTQQLHRAFHHMDERRYDAMLELFTEDGRWLRQGQWLEGRPAIRAALEARPADIDTRHVLSNAYVSEYAGDRAVLEATMTAYRYPAGNTGTPPTVAGPLRLNLVTTVFRRDAGQDWRMAEQRMVPVIAFGN